MSEEERVGMWLAVELSNVSHLCAQAGKGSVTASRQLSAFVNRDGRIEIGTKDEVGLLLSVAMRMEPPGGRS